MKNNSAKFPILLCILDGFALNPNQRGNAVFHAKKPIFDSIFAKYPKTTLSTHGLMVGLPAGQMGNSEVGHLNIGAGRIVDQDLTRINKVVDNKAFLKNENFVELCKITKKKSSILHLIGLTSTGGVHSDLAHLFELISAALEAGIRKISVHAITDGRDRPPTASIKEIQDLENHIINLKKQYSTADVHIATLCGRYTAMDRDTRWERTEAAYKLYTEGIGETFVSTSSAISAFHERKITDEFFPPALITSGANELESTLICNDDVVLFFNFRTDRMKQIVRSFTDSNHNSFPFTRNKFPKITIATLTEYDPNLPVLVLFPPLTIKNHLGEFVSKVGFSQLRIAETEKYAHVTYFFNGGQEEVFPGEERILIPSPRDVKTYDLKPEMSAYGVTSALLEHYQSKIPDFTCLNFANCDMVGHTGNFSAAVKAVEVVDSCLGKILDVFLKKNGIVVVTADHGNADQMIDYETGEPHTFHTMHPVPFIIIGENIKSFKLKDDGGALCDIAPTILDLWELEKPLEMTGSSLIKSKK